ncbi:hypothetical protein [Pseudobacteriovorax antillogorgiicola]|uniref:Uncharacterized protein n=1 Tax=Pseudobacteriovorax antillogorgiicola TaxID=1513793 RepID=A0A1Y6BQK9_9BACT|nr:hypothetical protein [Pseudobacteriovorax antillogorgiicola]TCS53705.1 hypothetical protein EDD56_10714 [Pseudobacteriovorax antillogorgiicola]SMF22982.1 hypothetical protein SAMN06296036_107258 [Pseudobacteriovorax antillogorgiicola]
MKLFFAVAVLVCLFSPKAQSLELKTVRHSICGVESYHANRGEVCGIERYNSQVSSLCPPALFNEGTSEQHCGTTRGACAVYEDCNLWYRGICAEPVGACVGWERIPASCRHSAFGVAAYSACERAEFGVALYKQCSHPSFGVSTHRSCSMYKTPEELNEYLTNVSDNMELYLLELPEKKKDLYAKIGHEKALWCMIDKYSDDDLYWEVVTDAKDTFFLQFGYDYSDVTHDCSVEEEIRIVLDGIDCDTISTSDLRTMPKPDGISQARFVRFKSQCATKKSHDLIVDWFEVKDQELGLLINDIVARQDANVKSEIEHVQRYISNR